AGRPLGFGPWAWGLGLGALGFWALGLGPWAWALGLRLWALGALGLGLIENGRQGTLLRPAGYGGQAGRATNAVRDGGPRSSRARRRPASSGAAPIWSALIRPDPT